MKARLGTLWISLVGATLAAASPAFAGAAEPVPAKPAVGCRAFAWPVDNERAWFAERDLRRGASGVRLSHIDRAVELTLEPTRDAHFFLPPEKAPQPDSYSGAVTFRGVPHTGLYQVTVSRNADIEVFENGMRIAAAAVSVARDCDGIRRSERFVLAPGDLVLVQVSGAARPSIKVAFEEAR
jgi:hypothetical protein